MSSITLRSGKGSALTHTEVDNNFSNLNTDKVEDSDVNSLWDTRYATKNLLEANDDASTGTSQPTDIQVLTLAQYFTLVGNTAVDSTTLYIIVG